ncbi:MAG: flavodoxin family protein [Clostridia bacterium]|nr:flavodoxin family protein [Clostridia bacterium]
MRILVLNGSPKRDRSDTMVVTRAFLEGMNEAAPQDVKVIDVIDKHVEYCTGCFSCMFGAGGCVIEDDMRGILEDILSSDLLLLSFPLYCYGMPAPLKAVIDRVLPLSSMEMQKSGERYEHVGRNDLSGLRYMMICGCGFPNSKHNFEAVVMQFRLLFHGSGIALTMPECPMFNAKAAEPVTGPRLELVRRAGAQFASGGAIDEALMAEICSPMIPEEVYASIVNSGVK